MTSQHLHTDHHLTQTYLRTCTAIRYLTPSCPPLSLQAWDLPPSSLLMVGDSFEDVEVGNAAGTASCLIAGGGNEKPGANITPPAGAVPTFSVNSLTQLRDMLRDGPKEAGQVPEDGALQLGWPAREGKPKGGAGAPPPGLEFLDFLVGCGALRNAAASFPRMGRAAGGLATCSEWGRWR
jgi:hypothetical protein